MKEFIKILVLIISIFMVGNSFLYSGEGRTAAIFLKFSESAREASLAGAYSSLGDDSNSIFSNPASIINVDRTQISLGFTSYIENSKLGLFSFVSNGKNNSKFGFAISAFNVDGIEKRGLIDQSGIMQAEGTFSSDDMSIFVSYAKKDILSDLIDNLSGGINFKLIRSKIDTSSAYSIAIDCGFLYNHSDNMKLSFVFSNFGTKMKFEDDSDSLPLSIKAGGSYNFSDTFKLATEVEGFINESAFYPSIGFEFLLREGFAFRSGYKFGYDNSNLGKEAGLSFGFGINTKDVSFNYANVFFGELGNVNKFDISIKF